MQQHLPQMTPQKSKDLSTEDILALVMVAPALVGLATVYLPSVSGTATSWLISHQIFVAAADSPVFTVAGADGAGLDMRRLVLLGVAAVIAVLVGVSALRRRIRRRLHRRLIEGDPS